MPHPLVILDDPRCTPQDTPMSWALKVLWPRALADPNPPTSKRNSKKAQAPSRNTLAESWALTEHYLRLEHPQGFVCKGCGTPDSPDNPLLWGNPEIAEAHGIKIPDKIQKQIFFAQNLKPGDTDSTLIGYSTRAPMVYCLACSIGLSTRVANVLLRPHLAFYWTPRHEALPWDQTPALWELPPERPLIVRTATGTGKNNEKWFATLAITWDPHAITLPLIDRKRMRGAFPVSLPVDRVRAWPAQFREWLTTQKSQRKPTSKEAFKASLFSRLLDTVAPPLRFVLKSDDLYAALKLTTQKEES